MDSGAATNNADSATHVKQKPTAEQLAVAYSLLNMIMEGESSALALFGAWGRGKSSIAYVVKDKLGPEFLCIRFPSWRYPSRPECWIHLYRTIFDALKRESSLHLYASIIRMNFERSGGLYAMGSMFYVMGWLFFPTPSALASSAWNITWAIGPVAAIFFLRIFLAVPGFFRHLQRVYWKVETHVEKLGIQETIGSDLRDLLTAWSFSKPRSLIGAAWYSVAMLFFPYIALSIWGWIEACDLSNLFWDFRYRLITWTCFTLVFAISCIVLSLLRSKKSRILIIVEDLDRVSAEHSLAITESISLFLGDEEKRQSMTFLFLLDENALDVALKEKHPALVDQNVCYYTKERLFESHVRLPQMSLDEARTTSAFILEQDTLLRLHAARYVRPVQRGNLEKALREEEARLESEMAKQPGKVSVLVKDATTKEVPKKGGVHSLSRFYGHVRYGFDDFPPATDVVKVPAQYRLRDPNDIEIKDFRHRQDAEIDAIKVVIEKNKQSIDLLQDQRKRDDGQIAAIEARILDASKTWNEGIPFELPSDDDLAKIVEIVAKLSSFHGVIWGPRSVVTFRRKFSIMMTFWQYLEVLPEIRPLHDWEKLLMLDLLFVELVAHLCQTHPEEKHIPEAAQKHRDLARRLARCVL